MNEFRSLIPWDISPHRVLLHWLSNLYRCQFCSVVVPPGTRAQKVVCETRPKHYGLRTRAFEVVFADRGKKKKVEKRDDPGGSGFEIAREALACPECAAKFTAPLGDDGSCPTRASPHSHSNSSQSRARKHLDAVARRSHQDASSDLGPPSFLETAAVFEKPSRLKPRVFS